jgi:2,3-dihydroxy-p-cumate/2,3-dihydroxybenzoate 3,4-dioxygenase
MIKLEQLRYVRLGTRNIAVATSFATTVLGLQHIGTESGRAYFRSDFRDYTLCYFATSDHYSCFAVDVRTKEELEATFGSLTDVGLKPRYGTDAECGERRVKAFLFFEDFTGNIVEIVLRPLMSGWRFFPSRDSGVMGLQSVAHRTTRPEEDERLWTKIFNGRVSDWVGEASYIRIDDLHHRLSLHPSNKSGLLSVTYAVESIDQLMQSNYILLNSQIRIVQGPGREPTSGQVFLTFEGPDGTLFNFATGMDRIIGDEAHQPRQFPDVPLSYCSWGTESSAPEMARPRKNASRS